MPDLNANNNGDRDPENRRTTGTDPLADEVRTLSRSLRSNAQHLDDTWKLRIAADQRFDSWESRNENFALLNAREIFRNGFALISLIAAILIDSTFLVDAGREITRRFSATVSALVGHPEWITLICTAFFALAFIALEVAIGCGLAREREAGRRTHLAGAFAVIAWLTLPIIIVAITLANSGLISPDQSTLIGPATYLAGVSKIIGTALAALVVHGFVLWNGGIFIDTFAYFLVYLPGKFYLRRACRRLGDEESRLTTEVEGDFWDLHELVSQRSPGTGVRGSRNVQAGPFGERTRTTVNRVFGYDVIEEPNRQTAADPEWPQDLFRGGSADAEPVAAAVDSEDNSQSNDPQRFAYSMAGEDEVRQ